MRLLNVWRGGVCVYARIYVGTHAAVIVTNPNPTACGDPFLWARIEFGCHSSFILFVMTEATAW